MKRDEIKALLPDISDEALGKILDINGKDIEKAKGAAGDLQTQLETAQNDLKKAQETITSLESANGDTKALQAEIDKYKQAEKDREAAETAKAAEEALRARFEGIIPEKHQFVNDFTKNGVLAEFKAALNEDSNKGKGDKEIFDAIIKDRDGIFANPNKPGNIPGKGNGTGDDAVKPVQFF